jgi:hypothetical protein
MANPLKILYNKFFPAGIQTQNNNIDSQTFDPNLTHSVSMISGFDGTHENLVTVDASGNLHVNSAASSYLHYYLTSISPTETYTPIVNVTFPAAVSYIQISITNHYVTMAFVDTTTGQLGPIFSLQTGNFTFQLLTTGAAVYANSAGNTPTVSFFVFY